MAIAARLPPLKQLTPAVAERELSDIRPSTSDSMLMPWRKLNIRPTLVPECSQEPCLILMLMRKFGEIFMRTMVPSIS